MGRHSGVDPMHPLLNKILRFAELKGAAMVGQLTHNLDETLAGMAMRPYELHLELTNLCNAKCIFCPYQFQKREHEFMSDGVFEKAVGDYIKGNGGPVMLTPIVGDPLIDPKFLERVRKLRQHAEIDRIEVTTNGILLDKFG